MRTVGIIPHLGLSFIRFGMTRGECRALVGTVFTSFSRNGGAFLEVDMFDDFGVQLNFDMNNMLEFLEVSSPGQVEFGGVYLLGRRLDEAVGELESIGLLGVIPPP